MHVLQPACLFLDHLGAPCGSCIPCKAAAVVQAAAAPAHPLRPPLCCAPTPAQEPEEGLLPEEDEEIAGTYKDALSTKTPLGKAVAGACDELEALGSLVRWLRWGEGHRWAAQQAAQAGGAAGEQWRGRPAGCTGVQAPQPARIDAVPPFWGRVAAPSHPAGPPSAPPPPLPCLQEKQTLEEAEGLLKKLGFKGSLFAAPLPPPADPQQPGASQE